MNACSYMNACTYLKPSVPNKMFIPEDDLEIIRSAWIKFLPGMPWEEFLQRIIASTSLKN